MERKVIFLSFLLFVLLTAGCGSNKSSSVASRKGGSVVMTDFSPSEPTSSDAITLKITAVAGETPEYKWIVNGMLVSASGNRLSPEHFSKNDTVFCSILIGGEEKKKVGPIVIKNSNPRINSVEISPSSPQHGTDLSLNADVDDADGDDITLLARWFVNEKEVSTEEVLSGSKIKAADKVYALVTPFDGTNEGLPVNSGWVLVQNSPPEIVSAPPSIEGRTMNYEIEMKDGDGDNIDLSLEQGPNGMRLEGNRLIWEAPEIDKDTSFLVKIKARDERGGETSVSFSLDVRKREMQ
jgi:hypothetical protein